MPFLIAPLSILFYAPYVAFKFANADIFSLKNDVQDRSINAAEIVNFYFNHQINSKLRMRFISNILIKMLYLAAYLITFLVLNSLLNNEYISYGSKWVSWTRLDNSIAFDYLGMRDLPKPGRVSFSYCFQNVS